MTNNYCQALWHICKRFGPVTIWLDLVWINQDGQDEKASHIPLMADIYSLADSVYLHLARPR